MENDSSTAVGVDAFRRRLRDIVSPDWTIINPSKTEPIIRGLTHDSRTVSADDLFVALRGGYFDGHQFLAQAEAQGAAALLVEQPTTTLLPQIVVPDTRAALPFVAASFYGFPAHKLDVIGITGTDGKTTTSYITEAILRAAAFTTGVIGTIGVRIGEKPLSHVSRQTTPESDEVQRILWEMVMRATDAAIIEATSHGLALHRLDEISFRVAAVTNITREHLDFHGTVENYRRAKAILFERITKNAGHAVINIDDEGARWVRQFTGAAPVLTYSMTGLPADITASQITFDTSGTQFLLTVSEGSALCRLPLLGNFNVANALCATAVATALGIDLQTIIIGLETVPSIPGRMTIVNEGQPFHVIVDYAHTPESLTKVLHLLRSLNPQSRLIVVSGSAGERDIGKRAIQGSLLYRLADFSIFTTEDPRFEDPNAIINDIANGAAQAGGRNQSDFACIVDREEAIRYAFSIARQDDIILLAGKGHEQSIIWGLEKRPWNEEAIARKLLNELGYFPT